MRRCFKNLAELSIKDAADLRDKVIATLDAHVTMRQRRGAIDRLGGAVSSQLASTARPNRPVKYRDGQTNGCGTMPARMKEGRYDESCADAGVLVNGLGERLGFSSEKGLQVSNQTTAQITEYCLSNFDDRTFEKIMILVGLYLH